MNVIEYNKWRNNWFRQNKTFKASTKFFGWDFFDAVAKYGSEQDIPYLMHWITKPLYCKGPPVQAIITIAHRSKNEKAIMAGLTAHLL